MTYISIDLMLTTLITSRTIARATRCDAAHLRWWVPNELRYLKFACDVLRLKVQHAQYFAPDLGISQLFISRFSNDFQHNDGHVLAFHVIHNRKFSVNYF